MKPVANYTARYYVIALDVLRHQSTHQIGHQNGHQNQAMSILFVMELITFIDAQSLWLSMCDTVRYIKTFSDIST